LYRPSDPGADSFRTWASITRILTPHPQDTHAPHAESNFLSVLDQWNPEFFERLHGFVGLAEEHGVIVEVVLLSNTYNEQVWGLNPLHNENNINNLNSIPWYTYMTTRSPQLFDRQKTLVRKIVTELNDYDNIVFEICNEPGGNIGTAGAPTCEEVDSWLKELIQLIRQTEAQLPQQHLVFGQQAFVYQMPQLERPPDAYDVFQLADESFREFDYDAVNTHALSNMWYRGQYYDLGLFMMARMNLEAFRDYTLAIYFGETKPLVHDEDNNASQYRDEFGWTIHRKRAWTALFCGAHYDYIDFSIIPGRETGLGNHTIRTWFQHLSSYIHALDLVKSRPLTGSVRVQPEIYVESVFGIANRDVSIYVADAREQFDAQFGEKVRDGKLTVDLEEGSYAVSCFDPSSGGFSPPVTIQGGPRTVIGLPTFRHDIVLRLQRR